MANKKSRRAFGQSTQEVVTFNNEFCGKSLVEHLVLLSTWFLRVSTPRLLLYVCYVCVLAAWLVLACWLLRLCHAFPISAWMCFTPIYPHDLQCRTQPSNPSKTGAPQKVDQLGSSPHCSTADKKTRRGLGSPQPFRAIRLNISSPWLL